MTRKITVAAIQASYGLDLDANIARTAELIREAAGQGAQVVLPPEIGRASCRERCPSKCRSRWSPYH